MDTKRNILGLICGYSFIFLNSEMVNDAINKLFFKINIPGEGIYQSILMFIYEILSSILLCVSLFGIVVLLFFSIMLIKRVLNKETEL